MNEPKLTDVRGIGPKTADGLAALGIDSLRALTAAPNELIATLPGFHLNRAQQLKDAAVQLTTPTQATPAPVEKAITTSPDPEKKKKKDKKKSGKKKTPTKKKATKKPDKQKKKKKKSGKGAQATGKKKTEKKSPKKKKKKNKAKSRKKTKKSDRKST